MKIEKINDNQIRCTLTRDDLAQRQLKLSELAYGSEKAKSLFREMMQQAASEFQAELAFRGLALENRLSVHQLCIHGKTAARTLESDVNTVLISTEFANFQSPRSGKLKVSAQRIVERCLLVVRHHPEKLQRLLLAVHVFDFHGSALLNDPSGTIAGIAKPCLCKCFIERPGTNPDRRQVAANDFPCSHGCYKSLHVAFPFHLTGE